MMADPVRHPPVQTTDCDTRPVLEVEDLDVTYYTDAGRAKALDGVSLRLGAGEKLGLVGESGAGKSTMALAIMRMIKPPGRIESGRIVVDGVDLLQLSTKQMVKTRQSKVAYIPQGAMNSLNPVMRIGNQMVDAMKASDKGQSKREMVAHCTAALELVDLDAGVMKMYPHELSGGMKQRVCIAIGILLDPKLIVADEPTSALDVVTQRQVMETIDRLRERLGAAVILIGHDMGLMAQFVDRVAVLYAGRLAEVSAVEEIFEDPLHPYAAALIASVPSLKDKGVFRGIPGLAPALLRLPDGCAFHPRCPAVMDECRVVQPPPVTVDARVVACHLHPKVSA